jgi:YaiO family outer membrane protein
MMLNYQKQKLCFMLVLLACNAQAQTDTGSIQLGYGRSLLSNNNANWNDFFARGYLNLSKEVGVLNWEVSQQKHFGESGQTVSASLSHDFSPLWYGSLGLGVGSGGSFLAKYRLDGALYRKWLERNQLITGIQLTQSKSRDNVHDDQSCQVSASYYFDNPFVAELGFKRNISDPGSVGTNRSYLAGTYGTNKQYYLTLRYDTGREGYLPVGANVAATNFKSSVTTLTLRQWISAKWAFELQAERYNNPFYRRRGLSASVVYDF